MQPARRINRPARRSGDRVRHNPHAVMHAILSGSLAALLLLASVVPAAPAVVLERVVVSHSIRGGLSIGPLLYGIERGFYRAEGIDLVYVSIRADLGIKAMLASDVDYIYSAGTALRAAVRGVPVKALSFDFYKVFHSLMARPEIKS